MWAIIKKELKTYFVSPIGYVFIGIFLLAFSISFNLELAYSSGIIDFKNIFVYIFQYLPTIIAFAFLIPMLTMRSFAEERKNGTEQLLLTSPVGITKIVFAKFISAVIIVLIAVLLLTIMFMSIVCCFGNPDISASLATLLGFMLLCMAYISFGIFASTLTENQIVAAMITIITFIITWVLPEFIAVGSSFSLINMFYKFTTGQIDIAYTITYLAFTLLCLILSITVMQRRKSAK